MDKLLIVAGEHSGDMHAAHLYAQLKEACPHLAFYSAAGEKTAQHATQIVNLVNSAAMGIVEVAKYLPAYFRAFSAIETFIAHERPRAAILVDFPDFNLRLARKVKSLSPGTKVIYYISPQVWAWRKNRVAIIRKYVDRMLVLFKFEEDFYRDCGVQASFVGHPLLEIVKTSPRYDQLLKEYETSTPITLMPGSREKVIRRHLPLFLDVAGRIYGSVKNAHFFIVKPPQVRESLYCSHLKKMPLPSTIVSEDRYDYMRASRFALVSSGTATIETAMLGTPFCIIYAMNPFSFFLLKKMVHAPYAGMINILYGKKVVEEFIQTDARAEPIARHCLQLLGDPSRIREMQKTLQGVRTLLGEQEWSAHSAVRIITETLALPRRAGTKPYHCV